MTTRIELQPIDPEKLYSLRAAKRVLAWGDAALRSARKSGLRVRYVHSRGFLMGRDIIEYVLGADDGLTSAGSVDAADAGEQVTSPQKKAKATK